MGMMKILTGAGVLAAVALITAATNSIAATGPGPDADRQVCAGCYRACRDATATICEPAEDAAAGGRIPGEHVQEMCECGILVCANTCARESGHPGAMQALPQVCYDLGVH